MTAGGFSLSDWVVSDAAPQCLPGSAWVELALPECRQLLEPWGWGRDPAGLHLGKGWA